MVLYCRRRGRWNESGRYMGTLEGMVTYLLVAML